ncbi:hypothetical protein [Streptomyces axinellae]|jgi:hypothetical protein|uniref:Uncharacterized protein n=1 Tax=Streptomyces axinellae TaxID=552788 RepID=A0ABP6C874_9ACTN
MTDTVDPWVKIGEGPEKEIILAVDFDVTGRLEANFRDLVGLLPEPVAVWQTVPPAESYRRMLATQDYLTFWREYPGKGRKPVSTVLGYCVGSVFASELADEIEKAQGSRPRLLLFDPEMPNTLSLYRDFGKVTEMMSVLSAEEKQQLLERAEEVRAEHGEEFDAVSGRLIELYEEAGGAAFERLGLDEDLGAELLGLFRAYVSYLAAARKLDPSRGWREATAITSVGSSTGARQAVEELRFETSHDELLRSPQAAAAAAAVLRPKEA